MKILSLLLVSMLLAFSCARRPSGSLEVRTPSEEDIQKAKMLLFRLRDTSDIEEIAFVLSSDQSTLTEYGAQVVHGMNHLLVYEDAGKWLCFVVYEEFRGELQLLSHMTTNEEAQKRNCWETRKDSLQDN